jgi:hypothetical protein
MAQPDAAPASAILSAVRRDSMKPLPFFRIFALFLEPVFRLGNLRAGRVGVPQGLTPSSE